MSDLRDRIETARRRLASGHFANEAAISTGIVLPILDALGWDAFDPAEVAPEYKVRSRRVDFALVTAGTPAVFVEVKQPGQADGADQQLFEYAFMEGVPLAVLTDGSTWSVYVPAEKGSMDERRAFFLDLAERAPSESADKLTRYLARDAVASGEAFERARRDCQRARQRRGAKSAIPQAWSNLVAGEDETLLNRLAAEVESASGFQPETDDILAFLRSLAPGSGTLPKGRKPRKRTPPPRPAPEAFSEADGLPARGFEIVGEFVAASTGINLLHDLLKRLAAADETFLPRLAERATSKKRAFVARDKAALYPDRPDLRTKSRPLPQGYWLATNNSTAVKRGIVAAAAEIAGLRLGEELRVRFEK